MFNVRSALLASFLLIEPSGIASLEKENLTLKNEIEILKLKLENYESNKN